MVRPHPRRYDHLRLVEPSDLPHPLADPAARREFALLSQALVDAVIEMLDLVDGDPDAEPNGDDVEDGEGI
jgi:hypothetical protein